VQQRKLFEPDAHCNRRDEELLGEGLGEAIEGPIVVFDERGAGNVRVEALDLDEGVVDRFGRLKNPLLTVWNTSSQAAKTSLRGISKHEA